MYKDILFHFYLENARKKGSDLGKYLGNEMLDSR